MGIRLIPSPREIITTIDAVPITTPRTVRNVLNFLLRRLLPQESEEYVNDACISDLKELDHVLNVEPVYTIDVLALKGSKGDVL